jgi:hypothetical protein
MLHQWVIFAKSEGICKETGKPIKVGDEILYIPGIKNISSGTVYCKDSKAYKIACTDEMASTGFKTGI